jgi:predicted DNA-binding WGR domain protein
VTSLSIRLEARSAAQRCYRAYAIDVATDLFGAWLVDMSYGRIGTIGRTKIRSFATIEDAQDQVRACLRKRATAPRRIGVAYHVRRVDRNEGWREPAFDDQLRVWFPPAADAASTGGLP